MKEAQWGLNCLKGQHQLMIPVERGVNRFHIHVIRGALRINHGAYTPDGGTWLSAPAGRPRGYDLDEDDDEQITVDIQESFGKQDILTVVNPNLIKEAEFEIEKSISLMEHKTGT